MLDYNEKKGQLIKILNSDLQRAKTRLQIELKNKELFYIDIQKMEGYLNSNDWRSLESSLSRIITRIRPLNVIEVKALLRKIKKASELIQSKEIFLFLGGTGIGKSTTIHYLAGSEMVLENKEGFHYIEPKSNPNYPTLVDEIK